MNSNTRRKAIGIIVGGLLAVWSVYLFYVPTALDGTAWRLIEMNGKPPLPDYPITLGFDPHQGLLGGNSGCNNYWGDYQVIFPGVIYYPGGAITLMLCVESVQQEEEYLQTIGGIHMFRISGNNLYIGTRTNPDALIFERIPTNEMPPFWDQ